MQKEERPSSKKYDFIFLGGIDNSYGFVTNHEIIYEIKFKPTGYLFDKYPIIAENSFEFVIEVAFNPALKNPPLDALIPNTIASIFRDFFENHLRVVVYICDTSDSHAIARKRKFDAWFYLFKGMHYFKLDASIEDEKGEVYYTSLITRQDNPHNIVITKAFMELTEGYKK
jgi:Family of unknown function (DUF6169)